MRHLVLEVNCLASCNVFHFLFFENVGCGVSALVTYEQGNKSALSFCESRECHLKMAAEGRAVIVSGVPTGIEEKRLTDKLCIHFLRKRHGGGDISSIILPKSTPGSAIITFEESEVAQRVVQYGKHILSVDDKTFELTVSLFCKDVDPDEVFLGVEVMVDYSRLPLGRIAVSCLQKSFPDVHFSFIPKQGLCKLKGRFSEVQALINQLLTLIDPQASAATTSLETTGSTNNLSSRGKTSSVDEPVYHLRCNDRQMESWFAKQASSHDLESLGNSERSDHSNHELDNYQEEKDSTVTRLQETPLEEYFLVMDSDIFKYLQKHCGEYQDILSQNRVEAVDICTQDITTVYLQTGEATVGEGVKHVKRVHQELGRLYQDKEAQLRKEQVLKEGISTEDLQQAFKALQQQLPRIMLSDDEMYIYIVGSGSEVSEAKQFFLDMQKATDESRLGRAGYTSLGHDMDSLFLPSSSASPSDSSGSIFDDGEINMRQKAYKKDIVGSGRDVLEAKQFILDNQWTGSGSRMESGIDTKPLLRPDKAFLFQPPTTTSSAVNMESTDSREMDTVQKSYRKDKMEAGKGYKLAARFMEAGNKTPRDAELGSYLSDTTVPQNTQKDLSCSTSKKISENRHWLGALPASVSGNLGVEYGRYSLKGHQGLSQIGNDMLLRRPCRNTALPNKRPLPPGLEELQNSEGKDPKHQDACGAEQSRDSNDTPEEQRQSCSCGAGRGSISRMACGVAFCQQCLHVHVSCKVCPKGIRGTMSWSEMCMTLPGHIKDMTLKITYTVPDGIQGEDHPSPGSPFQGGVFDAFLPLNKQTKRLLPLLKRAFDEGLTFTVMECHKVARVAWASIPHKTKMSGGKSVNGYPDSGFLRCLTEALKSLSFGEDRDTAKDQDKIKN
ncbi:hypothetical protein AGOR_G00094910 [Albula goreensis]|uniref:E3 ubiquitin-protein ligase n=1 Tax=Albula goreensis TaxID=1534307 RepID=A0A8T3DG36_9TELE|nr:hypothetical protein AGOR_G00094910 [Albula goreensis]